GAAYLIALGVRRLVRAGQRVDEMIPRSSLRRIYRQGVIVQSLNPKAALFFLALLPQFVDPARGSVALQIVVLGVVFVALGICSDGTWALPLCIRCGAGLPTNRAAANLSPILLADLFHPPLDRRPLLVVGRVRQHCLEPLQLLISPRSVPRLRIN